MHLLIFKWKAHICMCQQNKSFTIRLIYRQSCSHVYVAGQESVIFYYITFDKHTKEYIYNKYIDYKT